MLEDTAIEGGIVVGAKPVPRLEVLLVQWLLLVHAIKGKVREHFGNKHLLFVMSLLVRRRWEQCLAGLASIRTAGSWPALHLDDLLGDQSIAQPLLLYTLSV